MGMWVRIKVLQVRSMVVVVGFTRMWAWTSVNRILSRTFGSQEIASEIPFVEKQPDVRSPLHCGL